MVTGNQVRVWDLLIRIFHWALVLFFVVAYFTGEEESAWHIYSGYAVLGLVLFRIVWGIIGTRFARFSNFVYSPSDVLSYAKGFFSLRPKHFVGHNPLGGLMVIAMLIGLLATTATGLMVYALEERAGPFAPLVAEPGTAGFDEVRLEEREEYWEELHELFTNIMLGLILIHVVAVLAGSAVHRENLVMAMITGKKPRRPDI